MNIDWFQTVKSGLPEPAKTAMLLSECDYYGASRLISDKLKLDDVPASHAMWAHGWKYYPSEHHEVYKWAWHGQDLQLLVHREEERFLRAIAVGAPFLYVEAKPSGAGARSFGKSFGLYKRPGTGLKPKAVSKEHRRVTVPFVISHKKVKTPSGALQRRARQGCLTSASPRNEVVLLVSFSLQPLAGKALWLAPQTTWPALLRLFLAGCRLFSRRRKASVQLGLQCSRICKG
jgi:hypothetical protein